MTEGDSFFVAFERATEAAAAAVEAQRSLGAEPWPPDAAVRVRMGLHTGDGYLNGDGDYVGADVHRAARIEAAANGGQVLISEATRALIAAELPAGVSIRDMGEHRLKDLRPERLSQLDIEGLPTDHPPIRSLDIRPNNLPTQLTTFVGRDRELGEAMALLKGSRLLTLSGPGGTGKTRLSLQLAAAVAEDFPDGVWFVPLEPIRDPSLVAPTIARTLGLSDSTSQSAAELLAEHIGTRRILLVLDNFEQVVDAAPVVADLLRACPELRMIVTTRSVLRVYGEQEYAVPGLPAPPDTRRLSMSEVANLPAELRHPDPATLNTYESVRLFIARAVAVRPGFAVTDDNAPAVAGIVARLHGMPLAIELAAARVKLLSPDQILTRLEDQLALLTAGSRDLPERQQTLRGAIAWSYDLLDEPSRRLLARLSVFAGGWDLEAAESVCGPADELGLDVFDGLGSLVDQSLVRGVEAGEPRFVMSDTIREFAAEMLAASGEQDTVRERHARTFAALAEGSASHLQGLDQRAFLDRLERDHDNLRAALEWAVGRPEPELAVGIGVAMWRFWQQRGYLNEARTRLEAIHAQDWPLDPRTRGRLLEALGGVAYWQADQPAATERYEQALALWRELDDKHEIANALYNAAFSLGISVGSSGQVDEVAAATFEAQSAEALELFRESGDRVGEANVLWGIGSFRYFSNDPVDAERWFREALAIYQAEHQKTMEAWALHMLGTTVLKLGDTVEATEIMRHALRDFEASGDLAGVTLVLDDLSAAAVTVGDLPRAGRLRGAARQLEAATGTELAKWVEDVFEVATRPSARSAMPADDLARYGAEGAAMPLEEVIAYALELPAGTPPGEAGHTAGEAAEAAER